MTIGQERKGMFKFKSVLERSDNKLWGCHFPVPMNVAGKLMEGKSKRVICTIGGRETFQCAILYYKKGKPVISVNKTVRDSLGVTFGAVVEIMLKKDTSEYGLPVPEELKEVFRQDKEGKRIFHSLNTRQAAYAPVYCKQCEGSGQKDLAVIGGIAAFEGEQRKDRL